MTRDRLATAAVATCVVLGSLASGAASSVGAQTPTRGGSIVYRMEAGPDWIDPGLTWYTFGFMLTYATNRPLYSFSPEHPERPVPDLAAGEPEISPDDKTVTITLKRGIEFSPPVSREVVAQDVKYAIERGFSENVGNGYVWTYFGGLEGAPTEPGPLRDIAGIETPDDHTIVFRLTTPSAASLVPALVLPITAPVPEEYAARFDSKSPSTYDEHVVFTGPYMIRNDEEGNLVGLAEGIEVVRNPNWDPASDYRPAYLDGFRIEFGRNLERMARRVLDGSNGMCCDVTAPPEEILREALSDAPAQVGSAAGHGTRWVALNTTIGPLRNLDVRKAIVAASDRKALRRTRGGRMAGPVAQHFLPPGIPGFEESGGYEGFTDVDYMQDPSGDPALAKDYMLAARRDGMPISRQGKYVGDRSLLMIAVESQPHLATARAARRQIEELGFDVNLKIVDPHAMYYKWCGNPSSNAAICPNVGWFADFLDPQSLLEPTFSGDAIANDVNSNWSLLDITQINRAMSEASTLSGPERYSAWADVNRRIVGMAPGIPFLWDASYQFQSSDVNGVMNPYFSAWDLSFSSLAG